MTCIVNYPTKKAFKEAVIAREGRVALTDPSFVASFSGSLREYMETRASCTVTNHPKRSWFASVKKDGKGGYKIT